MNRTAANMTESNTISSAYSRHQNKNIFKRKRINKFLKLIILLSFIIIALILYSIMSNISGSRMDSYYERQLGTAEKILDNAKTPRAKALGYANIGYIYLKGEQAGKAIVNFKRALGYYPKSPVVKYWLGVAYREDGNSKDAIKLLNESLSGTPKKKKFIAYYKLGEIYQNQKKYDLALQNYKKSVSDNGTMWNSRAKLAEILEIKGKKKEALIQYKVAAKFNPENKKLKEAIKRLSK